MEILGLAPVSAIILICIIGVGIRTFMGMEGKKLNEFRIRTLFSTFALGLITSIGIVGATIEGISGNVSDTAQLIIVVGQIGTIIGVDYVAKKGMPKIRGVIKWDIRQAQVTT